MQKNNKKIAKKSVKTIAKSAESKLQNNFIQVFTIALIFTVILSSLITVTGCATGGKNQTIGTYGGAVTGAIVGAHFGGGTGRLIAAAIGTLVGSQLGAAIGKNMDEEDRRMAGNNAVDALEHQPNNNVSRWRNPNNNHSGEFVVTRTVENKQTNQVCRDYVHTVDINGREERLYGTACRDLADSKGYWHVR